MKQNLESALENVFDTKNFVNKDSVEFFNRIPEYLSKYLNIKMSCDYTRFDFSFLIKNKHYYLSIFFSRANWIEAKEETTIRSKDRWVSSGGSKREIKTVEDAIKTITCWWYNNPGEKR